MANRPIRISILADARMATENVNGFANSTEQAADRVVTGFADTKLAGGFGRVQEGFDSLDQKAMGFRDTVTGVQDSLRAYTAFTLSTADAKKKLAEAEAQYGKGSTEAMRAQEQLNDTQMSTYDKLLLVGTGVGDLASGMTNFIVPMTAMGMGLKGLTISQWSLNTAMFANPIFWVVAAIIALVAVIVIAWKKSDTFRGIVYAVWGAIKSAWGAIPGFVGGIVGKIGAFFSGMKAKITGFFSGAGSWLKDAGQKIIQGFVDALNAGFQWVKDTLGRLTGLLPDWKGPAGRDRTILRESGHLVMEGFEGGLEDRFQPIRSRLGNFTAGIATVGRVAGGTTAGGLTEASTGDPVLRVIIRELQKAIRVNGSLGMA